MLNRLDDTGVLLTPDLKWGYQTRLPLSMNILPLVIRSISGKFMGAAAHRCKRSAPLPLLSTVCKLAITMVFLTNSEAS